MWRRLVRVVCVVVGAGGCGCMARHASYTSIWSPTLARTFCFANFCATAGWHTDTRTQAHSQGNKDGVSQWGPIDVVPVKGVHTHAQKGVHTHAQKGCGQRVQVPRHGSSSKSTPPVSWLRVQMITAVRVHPPKGIRASQCSPTRTLQQARLQPKPQPQPQPQDTHWMVF